MKNLTFERLHATLQACPAGQDPKRHVLRSELLRQFGALGRQPAPDVVERLTTDTLNDPTVQGWLNALIAAARTRS